MVAFEAEVVNEEVPPTVSTPFCVRLPTRSVTTKLPPTFEAPSTVALLLVAGVSRLGGVGVKWLVGQNTDRVSAFAPIATEIDAVPRTDATCHSRHMQRSKLQFYSITSSAHFPVSNISAKLGPQMTKWLSLGSRCAARHPTSVVTCFFFARLLWIIGAQ